MIKYIIDWFNTLFPKPPKITKPIYCPHCGKPLGRVEVKNG
jgi:hypothetical protein